MYDMQTVCGTSQSRYWGTELGLRNRFCSSRVPCGVLCQLFDYCRQHNLISAWWCCVRLTNVNAWTAGTGDIGPCKWLNHSPTQPGYSMKPRPGARITTCTYIHTPWHRLSTSPAFQKLLYCLWLDTYGYTLLQLGLLYISSYSWDNCGSIFNDIHNLRSPTPSQKP